MSGQKKKAARMLANHVFFDMDRALEAGYTPAGLYIMSRWYKDNELTKRYALFFAASFAENIVGGPVAFGL